MRKELSLSPFGTATLGAVIDALDGAEPDADVQFDFCYLAPADLHSYRGYYDHLAIGWTDERQDGRYWPSVKTVLERLNAACGETFEGWKGGDYTMSLDTPLWVAKARDSGGTGIVAVEVDGSTVILHTAKVD